MSLITALSEFGNCARAILPIMTDPKETRDKKREALNMMVNELSEDTFKRDIIAKQIIEVINMKEEVCKEYQNTDEHLDGIYSWLPRMKQHKVLLRKAVEKSRKACGLNN